MAAATSFTSQKRGKGQNQKISIDFFSKIMNVRGRWGFYGIVERGITFVANAKAGMDNAEFEIYLNNAIISLYPDAADMPGKRVAIIVDSGPVRMQEKVLEKLRIQGFYLIASVPNTTHVTQATELAKIDRVCGTAEGEECQKIIR